MRVKKMNKETTSKLQYKILMGRKGLNRKEITEKISEKFSLYNFVPKKNIYEKKISPLKKYLYMIDVKRNSGGWYSLHLKLQLWDKNISNGVNNILKKVLVDKEIDYPKNWTQKIIKDTIKCRTTNNIVLELTDWRIFKQENELLEDFNKKFSIWFCVFNEIEEIENWKEQLYKSIEYSKNWFEMVDNNDYIINCSASYESMYLLKENNNLELLEKNYQENRLKVRLKKEYELFYKYLLE
jgi:hypothetical protein